MRADAAKARAARDPRAAALSPSPPAGISDLARSDLAHFASGTPRSDRRVRRQLSCQRHPSPPPSPPPPQMLVDCIGYVECRLIACVNCQSIILILQTQFNRFEPLQRTNETNKQTTKRPNERIKKVASERDERTKD